MGQDKGTRVLVSTIAPRSGGVPVMTRFACDTLAKRGLEPVLAWYEPYSRRPELSVPAFALARRRPVGCRRETVFGRYEGHAIGAWLPELEFTHYAVTAHWRRLVDACRYHVVVSGNCLSGRAFADLGIPFLAWIATPWAADRKDRARTFPLPRRMVDSFVNAPAIRRHERRILRSGATLALSRYTRRALEGIAEKGILGVLPMPVDTSRFTPGAPQTVPGTIGFSGRLSDPRKNIDLLLRAARRCRDRGYALKLELIGDDPDATLSARLPGLRLDGLVSVHSRVTRERLPALLQRLDVFVVPSRQEGLCIAALEAMACGCPVISTRCGGPEEYVVGGQTGYLVASDPAEMAEAIIAVVNDRALRARLATGARGIVEERYAPRRARRTMNDTFDKVFEGAGAV